MPTLTVVTELVVLRQHVSVRAVNYKTPRVRKCQKFYQCILQNRRVQPTSSQLLNLQHQQDVDLLMMFKFDSVKLSCVGVNSHSGFPVCTSP